MERKYNYTLGELIDRLSITQFKELLIPEHRDEYSKEIKDILHDIDENIKEFDVKCDAKLIRAIGLIFFYNREIWLNEANWRRGIRENNNLELSHSLNSLRNYFKNVIQEKIGGRKDYKLDAIEPSSTWIPSQ